MKKPRKADEIIALILKTHDWMAVRKTLGVSRDEIRAALIYHISRTKATKSQ